MTLNNKPSILAADTVLDADRERWDARFTVYRAAALPDLEAFLAEPGREIEVVVGWGHAIPVSLLERLPRLALVVCFSTGYEALDTRWLSEHGVRLATAGGINAHDVADHAIALMLSAWGRLPVADRLLKSGAWRDSLPPRPSLRGRRAGVVGLGRIGLAVARRMAAFNLQVSWWGPREKPEARYPRADSLIGLAAESDILVVAAPATDANRGAIDRAVLTALGPKGLLVNISRGTLVDEAALRELLASGQLGAAALDVFEREPPENFAEWAALPNTVLTPHIAGMTREAGPAMFDRLFENARRYFDGEPLASEVRDPL